MTPRSWLFVPGDSEAKIEKGAGCGADAIILDLEDSVAISRKGEAREIAAAALRTRRGNGQQFWVRVNPFSSGLTQQDLSAVTVAAPDGIVLPKSESGADVAALSAQLDALEARAGLAPGQIKIMPIATETPLSVFNLGTYDKSSLRLFGLAWGAEDLPAAVGATTNRNADGSLNDLCRLARSLCLAGAAVANVAAIETVYPDFRNIEGLRDYAGQGRRDGFTGMMAIHPAQVPVINEVMTPTRAEVQQAQKIIKMFEANPDAGVVAIDGKMIDLPHLKQARRIMAAMRV